MGYNIDGQLLEVCDCNVLCPCWIGENPDNGTCQGTIAWHIQRGTIDGVDVAGRTFAVLALIPGNILEGNWKALAVIDDGASDAQQEALVNLFTGKLGGPVADLAGLVGEIVGLERAKVTVEVSDGKGFLKMGDLVEAEMEPYRGATGNTTALQETIFTTIPGSPAYVSKALSYKRNTSQHGIPDVDLKNHNAVQGQFHFEA